MNRKHLRYVKIVAALHGLVLLVLVSGALFPRCRPVENKEQFVPVSLVVEPEPPAPPPDPVSPPRPPRPKIERSTKRVVREPEPAPRPAMTPAQIRRMLADDVPAPASPDEDAQCLELVRRILHGAWEQPSAAEAGESTAEVTIELTRGGKVVRRAVSRPSGNAAFDASVMEAVGRVSAVPGLTAGFLQRHPRVTVLFELE